jgi:hypothetical protein
MNNSLKKALLVASATFSLVGFSVATADVASAGYASGSASVTNIDGSTYSAGAEFGDKSMGYGNVTVTPTFDPDALAYDSITELTVETDGGEAGASFMSETISEQVVSVLNGLSSDGTALTEENINAYVSVVRAAAGADGLE